MANTKKPYFVQFGPAIPIVSVTDYSKVRLTKEEMANLWWLCGPTADRNMRAGLEMWQVIAIAYMEGLNHGAGIACQSSRARDAADGKGLVVVQTTGDHEETSESPWEGL